MVTGTDALAGFEPAHTLFALLVGVDYYFSADGDAKRSQGNRILSINNLRGCTNDVDTVRAFLSRTFPHTSPSVLTSSTTTGNGPVEPEDRLPTFANIKKEFDTVCSEATAGDMFLFHFSGHGAELEPVAASPDGNRKDPSLLTADFCRGKPAVRGWQLNAWLRRLSDLKVHVVVMLDSCHSGGAWRHDGNFRTPMGWQATPNLPADEDATLETKSSSVLRAADLPKSWAIDPEGFTLMAACESHERAAEASVDGRTVGAFTHAVFAYLASGDRQRTPSTYRTVRDQVAMSVRGQNPVVYGRDKLRFLGRTEPFLVTPLVVRVEAGIVYLPVGKAHGVDGKSEFTSTSLMPCEFVFSADRVGEFVSRAVAPPELVGILRRNDFEIVPTRWSFGDAVFRVEVDGQLGTGFQRLLSNAIENRVAGRIEVGALSGVLPTSGSFGLRKDGDAGVVVSGPASLVGYEGLIRGLGFKHDDDEGLAAAAAVALSHLGRFGRILALRDEASRTPKPFAVSLRPRDVVTPEGPFRPGQSFDLTFHNSGRVDLHLTVMTLGSAFEIDQLYPESDRAALVVPDDHIDIPFRINVPEELRGASSNATHRDIIRVIVTRGLQASWKSLELPMIWDANEAGLPTALQPPRSVERERGGAEAMWWIEDKEIFTLNT